MGGVMVVYGPPITHSLPPAVGASRTSQFMISKGPAVAQFESQWGGAYPVRNTKALERRATTDGPSRGRYPPSRRAMVRSGNPDVCSPARSTTSFWGTGA